MELEGQLGLQGDWQHLLSSHLSKVLLRRGVVKIQVLAITRFCKSLQTLATTSLPTLSNLSKVGNL